LGNGKGQQHVARGGAPAPPSMAGGPQPRQGRMPVATGANPWKGKRPMIVVFGSGEPRKGRLMPGPRTAAVALRAAATADARRDPSAALGMRRGGHAERLRVLLAPSLGRGRMDVSARIRTTRDRGIEGTRHRAGKDGYQRRVGAEVRRPGPGIRETGSVRRPAQDVGEKIECVARNPNVSPEIPRLLKPPHRIQLL